MKLVISKNKDNSGYYTKITNEYNNVKSEMYMTIQLAKNIGEIEYGLYEIDGFLTCYTGKEGTVKPKLVITSATPTTKYEKPSIDVKTMNNESDPFSDFSETIRIEDNMLE